MLVHQRVFFWMEGTFCGLMPNVCLWNNGVVSKSGTRTFDGPSSFSLNMVDKNGPFPILSPFWDTWHVVWAHKEQKILHFMCRSCWMKPRFFACFLWLDPFCLALKMLFGHDARCISGWTVRLTVAPPRPQHRRLNPTCRCQPGCKLNLERKGQYKSWEMGTVVWLSLILYQCVWLYMHMSPCDQARKLLETLVEWWQNPIVFLFFKMAQADPLCAAPSSSKTFYQVLYKVLNRSRPPLYPNIPKRNQGEPLFELRIEFPKSTLILWEMFDLDLLKFSTVW